MLSGVTVDVTVEQLRPAIESVRRAVARAERSGVALQRLRAAIEAVEPKVVRHWARARLRQIEVVRSHWIEPVDPLSLGWDPFERFGVQRKEVYWTQWLASLLRSTSHPTLARASLHALIDALDPRLPSPWLPDVPMMDPTDWRALADHPSPSVQAEATLGVSSSASPGRPDIVIRTPEAMILLELKLGGTWNEGQKQKYEAIAREHAGGRRVGLAYLTEHDQAGQASPPWHATTWKCYGLALRRRLRTLLAGLRSPSDVLPALFLVRAIEHHLMRMPNVGGDGLDRLPRADLDRLGEYFAPQPSRGDQDDE